jgi:hypothetical protein
MDGIYSIAYKGIMRDGYKLLARRPKGRPMGNMGEGKGIFKEQGMVLYAGFFYYRIETISGTWWAL